MKGRKNVAKKKKTAYDDGYAVFDESDILEDTADEKVKKEKTKKENSNAKNGASGKNDQKGASGKADKQDKKADGASSAEEKAKTAEKEKKTVDTSHPKYYVYIAFLVALSLFIVICYAFPESCGTLGGAIKTFFFGAFAGGAFLVPIMLLIHAIYLKRDVGAGMFIYKLFFSLAIIIFTSVILNTAFYGTMNEPAFGEISYFWTSGKDLIGGGVVGGVLGSLLIAGVGVPGTLIFSSLFLLIFAIFLFSLDPGDFWKRVGFYYYRACERRERRKKERAEEARRATASGEFRPKTAAVVPVEEVNTERRIREKVRTEKKDEKKDEKIDGELFDDDYEIPITINGKRKKDMDKIVHRESAGTGGFSGGGFTTTGKIPVDEKYNVAEDIPSDSNPLDELEKIESKPYIPSCDIKTASEREDARVQSEEEKAAEDNGEKPLDACDDPLREALRRTLDSTKKRMNGENVSAQTAQASENEEAAEAEPLTDIPEEEELPPPPPPYVFPPIEFLHKADEVSEEGFREDIRVKCARLTETLRSFNVGANIVGVSRGPTITRYELALDAGTRVRTIMNLVDDISLALATNGVRIEGIVPGKSVIGIEVPNSTSETVYIRSLIENEGFTKEGNHPLTAVLGKGVGGDPVYVNLAKMPHLLIAGTTGSGKSVCIQSMIVSLLYRLRPDEVKIVLIDPKKVEFNKYDGIPHLLVPVVSDPKKAAGALNWCVGEMERRFDMLESKKVANIEGYNKAIADDPTKEKLPYIVIAIDEFADLMMTASDEVETSVCRLAQKARAAGMHMILGTQRPSVDVITGLIKSNFPSRIALTVKSQIDSRTMIDAAGAEKLMGHGDMLYCPMGAREPARLQGTFVSDKEIEDIATFLRENAKAQGKGYSEDIMRQIEKEAAACGQKKKSADDTDEVNIEDVEDDPKLMSAIKLAVDSGKISTSLIQRKLSLGYGRAAKLIDVMEERGIIGPADGQKPREILITQEDYFRMAMNGTDEGGAYDDN